VLAVPRVKISLLVTLGIPFSLFGTFAVLAAMGHTVNVSVLLGVVIALGMLVDDAVVIVEAIYYRIANAARQALQASLDAIARGLARRCWPRWRRPWPPSCR
jgi:multidrug efflux pump subunit AcrB